MTKQTKPTSKTLTLRSETVRSLDTAQLAQVGGGSFTIVVYNPSINGFNPSINGFNPSINGLTR